MLLKEQVPHFNLCQTGAFPVQENNYPDNEPQTVEVTGICNQQVNEEGKKKFFLSSKKEQEGKKENSNTSLIPFFL